MSGPIPFPLPVAVLNATPDDDLVLDRLATWLAEVSADAALTPPSPDELPSTAEADSE